ncbi:MAG: HNH endonuclease signature motif containing protein [Streptosporangiaceae bacterium]
MFGLWPDPFAGPPDGENAWLADLSVPELDEIARQWEAEHPRGTEALGAGFTHKDRSEAGLGFGAGGPLDGLSPGTVLNVFAEDTYEAGLTKLSDDELVGFLCATRRLASRQEAMELAAVAEIDARRMRAAALPESSRAGEHVSAELAAALMLTGRSADALLCLARDLARLPRILQALREGRLDRARAGVFATELAHLDEFTAQTIAMALCLAAENMTTGQLRAELRRMILMVDPDAARRRADKARREARVEAWQETSGNGAISGRELPTAEMISADKRISAIARFLKSAGTPGSMDQIRAAVFIALLNGRDPATLLPSGSDPVAAPSGNTGQQAGGLPSSGTAVARLGAGGSGAGQAGVGGSETGPTGAPGSDGGWLTALTGSVNLTIPLSTYLRLSELPGEVLGIGALDAMTSRELADRLGARDDNRWCLTVTDENGRAVGHACSRRSPETARGAREAPLSPSDHPPGDRPPTGQPPGSHPPRDQPRESQGSGRARSEQSGGPARSEQSGGLNPAGRPRRGRHRADRKGDRRTTGRPVRAEAPAGRTPGTVAPGVSVPWQQWLSALEVVWLERGQCAHRREMSTYRPGPLLRHLIKVRQRTCSFPGCRRPASACDDDHTTAFDQGGRTCECNLAPLCRRHHRAKQAAGWRLDQAQPGFLVWTLPSGRTRTTGPGRYPAETDFGTHRIDQV